MTTNLAGEGSYLDLANKNQTVTRGNQRRRKRNLNKVTKYKIKQDKHYKDFGRKISPHKYAN